MASKINLQVHHARFFEYQPQPINCIAYDSTSSRVAVSRSDGSVQILSPVDNWAQEINFPGGADLSVEALVWCEDRLFAGGLSGNVVELDLDTQITKDSVSSNAGPVWCLAGNQDDKQLAAGTEDGCVVLFSLDGELQFLRLFGKQEGRILCIDWYISRHDNVIVTGGANNIRQWSVNSGQAVSRMAVTSSNRKETIVWCVAVTKDFTIISGDSRGVVTFWNGKLSTQIKSFHCHKADVLSLCLSKDQDKVYSGGVDAAIYRFSAYKPDPSVERTRWAYQLLHSYHSHDVRALACVEECVASGGVDCFLQVAKIQEGMKRVRPLSPFPSAVQLVGVDTKHKLVSLQYRGYLELWRLGQAAALDDDDKIAAGILPLSQNALKLIQLKTRPGQEVICSALSSNGQIAFSDLQQVRVYRFDVKETESSTPNLRLERVKHSLKQPARLMTFTSSGEHLVAAVGGEGIQVMCTKTGAVPHTLKTDSSVHILKGCPSSDLVSYATVDHKVFVADIHTGQVLFRCPVMSSQVSALSFSPHRPSLFIAYCNHKIYEMDLERKEYTGWSRQHSADFPVNWMGQLKTVQDMLFHPDHPNRLFLYTDGSLMTLNLSAEKALVSSNGSMGQSVRRCQKYKFVIHANFLQDGSLVVVERPPSLMEEQFPPSLKQKKFGIA